MSGVARAQHAYKIGLRGRSFHSDPTGGPSQAKLLCNQCLHVGTTNWRRLPPDEQVDQKFKQQGWTVDPPICPDCHQKAKLMKAVEQAEMFNDNDTTPKAQPEPPKKEIEPMTEETQSQRKVRVVLTQKQRYDLANEIPNCVEELAAMRSNEERAAFLSKKLGFEMNGAHFQTTCKEIHPDIYEKVSAFAGRTHGEGIKARVATLEKIVEVQSDKIKTLEDTVLRLMTEMNKAA